VAIHDLPSNESSIPSTAAVEEVEGTNPTVAKSVEIDSRDLQIKILLHEHTMIRNEVLLMLTQYKNHVRVLQLSATGILAIIYWYVSNPIGDFEMTALAWWMGFGIVFLVPVLCGYLVFDIVHTLYSMALLGARNEVIETQVAKIAGPNLMMWEKISKVFFSRWRPGGVRNPTWFHGLLSAVIIVILMGVVPVCFYWVLLSRADEAGVYSAPWWLGVGALSAVGVVGACFFYGIEVLLRMRPKADQFVTDLMAEQTRANDSMETRRSEVPK
jgi:hypothetical protein